VLVVAVLTRATAASRGRDGSGGVCGLGLYSPKTLQVRKEGIGRRIRSVVILESVVADGLRRKAALTRGPAASARHECGQTVIQREERGTAMRVPFWACSRLSPRERGGE
jgi:hypothetical protein